MKRLWISLATGLWGGTTMLAMMGIRHPDLSMAMAATLGAAVAGAILAPLFCRAHLFWTILAVVLATSLGAALAGGLVAGLSDLRMGLVMAPALVWSTLLQEPLVLAVWLAGAIALHGTARSLM
jgi:hypothetical protein